MRLNHSHALCIAIAAALVAPAIPALGQAVGNGGAAPPAVYLSPSPTLAPGARTQLRTDVNGGLKVAPISAQTTLPTHEQGTVPISTSTTLPTHEQGTVPISTTTALPVNVLNPPASQQINVSTTPLPTHENGTANVQFATPQPVYCVTGCSGGTGGSTTTTYSSAATTYASGTSNIPLQSDQYGRLQVAPFTLSLPSPLPANIMSAQTPTTGTINTNGGYVTAALNGATGVNIQITGTFVGTINLLYGDVATGAFSTGNAVYPEGNTNSVTASPFYATTPLGHPYFQVQATSWTSGTANIVLTPVWNVSSFASDNGNTAPIYFPNGNNGTQTGLSTNSQNEYFDGSVWRFAQSEPNTGIATVSTGGDLTTYIPGGTSAGQIVQFGAGRLVSIVSTSSTVQANPFGCWNSNTSATGNPLWIGILQPGVPVKLDMYATVGVFCQPTTGSLNAGNGVNVTSE